MANIQYDSSPKIKPNPLLDPLVVGCSIVHKSSYYHIGHGINWNAKFSSSNLFSKHGCYHFRQLLACSWIFKCNFFLICREKLKTHHPSLFMSIIQIARLLKTPFIHALLPTTSSGWAVREMQTFPCKLPSTKSLHSTNTPLRVRTPPHLHGQT